jgi:hypothetical protein
LSTDCESSCPQTFNSLGLLAFSDHTDKATGVNALQGWGTSPLRTNALSLLTPAGLGNSVPSKPGRATYLEDFARADFKEELQKPYWTVDDGVPILLGLYPPLARLQDLLPNQFTDEVAREAMRLRSIVQQAQEIGDLTLKFRPTDFINWALGQHIEVPTELIEIATARGMRMNSHPDQSEALRDIHRAALANYELELAVANRQNSELEAVIAFLQAELAVLKKKLTLVEPRPTGADTSANSESTLAERPLHTRERENLLAIAVVGAIKAFGYDPGKRNTAAKDLAAVLESLGKTLSEDCIRNHLNGAAEQLPPNWRAFIRK